MSKLKTVNDGVTEPSNRKEWEDFLYGKTTEMPEFVPEARPIPYPIGFEDTSLEYDEARDQADFESRET